jgi:tetratricopeptide (TPR) repeat protein
MEEIRFIFSEAMKTLALALLALLAAKAIGGLWTRDAPGGARSRVEGITRHVLYAVLLALVAMGARAIGYDTAAELYFTASQSNLERWQLAQAYNNASSAVRLRPGVLRYWQMLAATKLLQHQFNSLLKDEAALRQLGYGRLEEADALRCAWAHFFLGQYDQVIPIAEELIRSNKFYAASYVVRGNSLLALKKYPDAERSFLEVLLMFPSQEDAVEGLAHVYFLMGDTPRALTVLDQTAQHPFSAEARKRFASLKALYAR